jgi:organic radical activating enzyme
MLKLYIAETFHSIKGEGLYSGTPMYFVRFAGCNVGKRDSKDMQVRSSFDPRFKVLGMTCTAYDGRKFGCDTDYKRYQTIDLDDQKAMDNFWSDVWERRVVLTGGEPMMQTEAFRRMLEECKLRGKVPHVETSGTIEMQIAEEDAWIACAPKKDYSDLMLWRANEIKLLVDDRFNIADVPKPCFEHPLVFLCPINIGVEQGYYAPNDAHNVQLCIEYCKHYPSWRVGVQLHKLLGVR